MIFLPFVLFLASLVSCSRNRRIAYFYGRSYSDGVVSAVCYSGFLCMRGVFRILLSVMYLFERNIGDML